MTHKLWHTSTLYCIQLEINLIYLIGIIDQWKKPELTAKNGTKLYPFILYYFEFWFVA